MAKFQMKELIPIEVITSRLAEGTDAANATPATLVTNNHSGGFEIGKCLKLLGESRFGLCAQGNPIEAFEVSTESATADGYVMGSIQTEGFKEVIFDGLQATAGTGTVAIGDYVVCGTVVAKGTALSPIQPKVYTATTQTGIYHKWRVVSLGSAGTGAVGTVGVVKYIS
jgi:hypothetical protein